jgi:glutamate 5-kinase
LSITINEHRQKITQAKRIVIKIGTSSLLYPNGKINLEAIDELAFVLTDLENQGKEVLLVSSGAIGAGLHKLQLPTRPTSIPEQQAVAAVGQAELMNIYNQRFVTYGQNIAQVLLTRDVIEYPESRQNVVNTLEQLLKMHIIPIVNENDTVAVDELDHETKFGDNDQLSAIVALLVKADVLIMLSDIDGFYDANPNKNPHATLFREVHEINPQLMEVAGGSGSRFGTGGMRSKLEAAQRLMKKHQSMVLARGKHPRIIKKILTGEAIGTLFTEK